MICLTVTRAENGFSFKSLQYVLHLCSDLKVLMAAVERLPVQKNMDLSATSTCPIEATSGHKGCNQLPGYQ